MNLILFEPEEVAADGSVWLHDRRAEHIRSVLRAVVGQRIRTGVVNGLAGYSTVVELGSEGVALVSEHNYQPVQPWCDLILAAPRPRVLKRLWPQLATLGVGRIVILKAARVEKFYFSSQWVEPAGYRPLLIEGLMQAGTTTLPEVFIRQQFKFFVEDELEEMFIDSWRLLAHPGESVPLQVSESGGRRPVIAIGPEGGWSSGELEMLVRRGFTRFSLGRRVLRSDTACIALLSVVGNMLEV